MLVFILRVAATPVFVQNSGMEITAYVVQEGRFKALSVPSLDAIPASSVWVDVLGPTLEEAINLAADLGLHVALDERARTFEVYGHVEVEGDQLTMLLRANDPESVDERTRAGVLLVLDATKLVTLRAGSTPAAQAALLTLVGVEAGPRPPVEALMQVLSSAMQTTSKVLDVVEPDVRRRAHGLFRTSTSRRAEINLESLLAELGPLQARLVEVRYEVNLISRAVTILEGDPRFSSPPELREDLHLMQADLVSLGDFAQSVDDNLGQLVNATIGFIGIRQNASARWFSIVATIFMPPTLLAAVWGMNFKHMPELDNTYGYLTALIAMLLSATVPLWVMRKIGRTGP